MRTVKNVIPAISNTATNDNVTARATACPFCGVGKLVGVALGSDIGVSSGEWDIVVPCQAMIRIASVHVHSNDLKSFHPAWLTALKAKFNQKNERKSKASILCLV
jgi:hypothetical protein